MFLPSRAANPLPRMTPCAGPSCAAVKELGWRSVSYVLTDGAPSTGKYQSRTGVLKEFARLNRYRKAAIHTVEIGGEATGKRWRGFLREIAELNGGKCVRQ